MRPAWDPAWGREPIADDIAAAKRWAVVVRAEMSDVRHPALAQRAISDKVDFGALYLADPELLVFLLSYAQVTHQQIVERLKERATEQFFAQVMNRIFGGEFIASGDNVCLATHWDAGLGLVQKYFSHVMEDYSKIVSHFMEQYGFHKAVIVFAGSPQLLQEILPNREALILVMAVEFLSRAHQDGRANELWRTLSEEVRVGLLSSARTQDQARLILEEYERAEGASTPFTTMPASARAFLAGINETGTAEPLIGGNERVVYSTARVQWFLETVPASERATVLSVVYREVSSDDAGIIIRSAVGRHEAISEAINAMPVDIAAPLVGGELRKVPESIVKNKELASRYRAIDNFGAMKCCFRVTANGAGVKTILSPVWDALSNDDKAEFFRNLWLYFLIVQQEMFSNPLPEVLKQKLATLEPTELAAIGEACKAEVKQFLKERGIINFDKHSEQLSFPAVPALTPENWRPEFGREPAGNTRVTDFAGRAEQLARERWGRVEYSTAAQQLFNETFAEGQRAAAFRLLWLINPKLAAIIIRTMKFHDAAREMLSGLNGALLAYILEASLVGMPDFNEQTVRIFDQFDSGAVVRAFCLQPQEMAEQVINLLSDAALSRLLDQAFIVTGGLLTADRTRTYVHRLISRALVGGVVDREKVARALVGTQPETRRWVEGIFEGKLDILICRAQAERAFAGDEVAAIFEPPELNHQTVREIGQAWNALEEEELRALIENREKNLLSREFYRRRKLAEKRIEWAADQLFKGVIAAPIAEFPGLTGEVTAQVVVVDISEADQGNLLAVLSSLQPYHLVVARGYPTLKSRAAKVAAIITEHAGSEADHASVRAAEIGAVMGRLPGACRLLRLFNDKWVRFSVGQESQLRLATAEEETAARAQYGLLNIEQTQAGGVFTLPLAQIDPARDRSRLGPKVVKLADMRSRGFPVPPTAFITSALNYLLHQELGLFDSIPKILGAHPAADDPLVLREKLERIRRLFTEPQTPQQVVDVILELNRRLPGDIRIFRPGLPYEDLGVFSAAGFTDSPVSSSEEHAVVQAVLGGWASYWNELPFQARLQHGLDHFKFLPGGALMELIFAWAAGNMIVMENEVRIYAVHGQGQGAMQAAIASDKYVINRVTDAVVHTPPPERTRKIIFRAGVLVEVPTIVPGEANEPPINEYEVKKLAEIGRKLYDVYGPLNREVEWVLDYDEGAPWIVQDRGWVRWPA